MLSDLLNDEVAAEFETLPEHNRIALIARAEWINEAHPYQIAPDLHLKYTVFCMLAGRGAGKTRSAAETLWWWAWCHPKTMSIVLAPTSGDLKNTCYEGPSGLLACIPEQLVVAYNIQDHLITLSNGSRIRGISADSYDRLRGINSSFCWCDELAAFNYLGPNEAWDNMMLGLRIKPDALPHSEPRVIVTTTPRPKDLILDLLGREGDDVIISRASTYDNAANLAPAFQKQLEQYRGSKLYLQEVLGEVVDLEDGKVVNRDMFKLWPSGKSFPIFEYIIQSYDCAYTDKEYNDPTAMTCWGVFKPEDGPMSVLLIDCWAEHLTFPQLRPKVIEEWQNSYGDEKRMKRPDLILIEEKASGLSLLQELRNMHLPVRGWNPGRADKLTRLQITASIFTTGRVWLPESSIRKGYVRDWCEGFLSQICSFPDSTHDDYVDSATQAIRFLKDIGYLDIDPPPRYDDDDLVDVKPVRVNPYAV